MFTFYVIIRGLFEKFVKFSKRNDTILNVNDIKYKRNRNYGLDCLKMWGQIPSDFLNIFCYFLSLGFYFFSKI